MKPGIYDNIAMNDYVGDPCPSPSLSKGTIKTIIEKTLMHAKHEHKRFGAASKESGAMDFGSATHQNLLGGDAKVVYVDANDWRTKAAKEERDAARDAGNHPILAKHQAPIERMTEIAQQWLRDLGEYGAERTILWDEGLVWFRNRPDIIINGNLMVVDYKTTTNANPEFCIKSIVGQNGYDIQAALGLRGLDAILGEDPRRQSCWLFQEKTAPYACSLVGLGNEMRELADRKITTAAKLWKTALDSNEFPGYDTRIRWADPTPWATTDFEAKYGDEL